MTQQWFFVLFELKSHLLQSFGHRRCTLVLVLCLTETLCQTCTVYPEKTRCKISIKAIIHSDKIKITTATIEKHLVMYGTPQHIRLQPATFQSTSEGHHIT